MALLGWVLVAVLVWYFGHKLWDLDEELYEAVDSRVKGHFKL